MSGYSEKFKDPRWQKKRLEILNRDSFVCQRCVLEEGQTVHVHHKYYQGNKDPWDYKDEVLITLCEECHKTEHSNNKIAGKLLIHTLYDIGFFSEDLITLAKGIKNLDLPYHGKTVTGALLERVFNDQSIYEITEAFVNNLIRKENNAK